MQEAVLANGLCSAIAQGRELTVYNLLPYVPSMGRVVHANGQNLDVPLVEIAYWPRELAQLARARGSPASVEEHEQDLTAAETGQREVLRVLIPEAKIWRRFSCCGHDLR